MNSKKSLLVILILFAAAVTYATIPNEKPLASSSIARYIIGLPQANRENILKKLGAEDYKELKRISLSESETMGVRWKALIAIGQARNKSSKEDILEASQHSVWYLRNAALVAMEELDYHGAVDLAKKLIKDKALVVRSAAVDVLAGSAQGDVRGLLWEELVQPYNFSNKQSLWIRGQIMEILVDRPEKSEESQFVKLLQDKDVRVAYYATFALEKVREQNRIHSAAQGKEDHFDKKEEVNALPPKQKIEYWQNKYKKNYIEIN